MISFLSRTIDFFFFFLSLWIYLWLAETSQQPTSQTTWLKVTPHCNHCNHWKQLLCPEMQPLSMQQAILNAVFSGRHSNYALAVLLASHPCIKCFSTFLLRKGTWSSCSAFNIRELITAKNMYKTLFARTGSWAEHHIGWLHDNNRREVPKPHTGVEWQDSGCQGTW